MSRTFFVRINLDDFAAETAALDSTEERGQWLEGFTVGARGHQARETWGAPKKMGHSFGADAWEQAEELRKIQASKGRASGESRRKRIEPELNRGSTAVQPELNRTPTEPPTEHEPNTNRTRTEPQPDPQPNTNQSNSHYPKNNPPNPPGGEQGVGETEKAIIEAWDSLAKGLPPVGPWSARRRAALRDLLRVEEATADAFLEPWRRSVEALALTPWALENRVNIDYLLQPTHFRRYLDAWKPRSRPGVTPLFRLPPPTQEERERLKANRDSLLAAVPTPGRIP